MKALLAAGILVLLTASCSNQSSKETVSNSIAGTWQLVTAKVITKGDTATTYPVPGQEMIKLFTSDNHFAFFRHDINLGKDSTAYYDSGSGTYTLSGENYTEHLAYCSARGWENKDFSFTLQVRNDSLIQKGIEKIDSLKIDHEIVEIYTRKK
jgi:hypothetical protein